VAWKTLHNQQPKNTIAEGRLVPSAKQQERNNNMKESTAVQVPVNESMNETAEQVAVTSQAVEKKSAKRVSPKTLFEKRYGSRGNPSNSVLKMRLGAATDEVPQALVAYHRRCMKNAEKLIARLKLEKERYTFDIQTRSRYENGIRVGQPEYTVNTIKASKLRIEAELIDAKQRLAMHKQMYEDAIGMNSALFKQFIKEETEKNYIKRVAPSIARKCTDLIQTSESFPQLKALADTAPRNEFRVKFDEFIKRHGNGYNEQFEKRPKLLTKVIELVIGRLEVIETVEVAVV